MELMYLVINFMFLTKQFGYASFSLGTCNLQCNKDSQNESGNTLNLPLQSRPGKRGPQGLKGEPGQTGLTGSKGEPGRGCNCLETRNFYPTSCSDFIPNYGVDSSGVYVIHPFNNETRVPVYCDLATDGGGWMIFQRRLDGSENFYRNFSDYVRGFGKLTGEFWIGLNLLHELAKNGNYQLRVDMEDFENQTRYALYKNFSVGAGTDYLLTVSDYSGTAGDNIYSDARFSTFDMDQDHHPGSCATRFKGGWWYKNCHSANPNGLYLRGNHSSYADGINWLQFRGHYYSLKKIEMKIKKRN